MGLEPLTFPLRRHRVHLVRRKHRVIDVHVAAAEASLTQGWQTNRAHAQGSASSVATGT